MTDHCDTPETGDPLADCLTFAVVTAVAMSIPLLGYHAWKELRRRAESRELER